MGDLPNGVGLHEVVIPVVCFAICIAFQTWEFSGSHDELSRARSLFKSVRAGWVKQNFMGGTVVVNTTRDYIKSSLFFANTAITLATFAVGYAGSIYTDCKDDGGCSSESWLFVIKLGVLAVVFLSIFFVFTQCTRFAGHFSFCMNTKELNGVPISHSLLTNIFNHSHNYFSLGMRLYFGTIPVFAWIFTSWALLAVTPAYVYMVRGLEDAGFVQGDIEEMARLRDALPPSSSVEATPLDDAEQGAAKRL